MSRATLTKLALMLGGILFATALMEICVRIMGWGQVVEFTPSERWGYLMTPSQEVSSYGHPVIINSLGLRGHPVMKRKPPGKLRILFVGDSVTYGGARLKQEELFATKIQQRIARRGSEAEIVNLSAPAWSPQNWIAYIESNGLHEADVVVLVLPECDLGRRFSTIDNRSFQQRAPPLRVQSIVRWAYLMASQAWSGSESPFVIDPPTDRATSERRVEANVQAVSKLLQICRGRGVPSVVALLPSLPASQYSHYWPRFEAIIAAPLDLRNTLNDDSLFMDGTHLSRKGHDFVAQAVFEELKRSLPVLDHGAGG